MALLQWKDQYAIGIDAVDHEHRELIDLINKLHDELISEETVDAFFGDLFTPSPRISLWKSAS